MTLTVGNALVFEGMLSLKLTAVPALPSAQLLTAVNEANEVLLHNVLTQDDKHEYEEHDQVMMELKRQDAKMRLIMELLGMLLMQQQLLPSPVRVRFSGEELATPAANQPTVSIGSWLRCDVYIDPAMPKPLVVHAEVVDIQPIVADGDNWLQCRLHGLSSNVQDCMEKVVFRQHRKSVAQQRRLTAG